MTQVKVEFGSGGRQLDGFISHDLITDGVDISKPLPYADNSVDYIYCSHTPEHISCHECHRFFLEVYRILKPGGGIRLCMPVLDRLDRDLGKDIILNHGHQCIFSTSSIKSMLYIAGFEKDKIHETDRQWPDNHHHVIGEERDTQETARIEATK